jgi:hypothetical protein
MKTTKGLIYAGRFFALATVLLVFTSAKAPVVHHHGSIDAVAPSLGEKALFLYEGLHLGQLGLNEKAWQLAIKGWEKIKAKGQIAKDIISICDFTQSSNRKRLYIIDLAHGRLLFNTFVAHGKYSGEEYANSFSNQPSSLKSSLGFYTTREGYAGAHGLALKLIGLEKGFNDLAEERAIVMHGAEYATEQFINQYGRLGKSFGCPAVPMALHEQIIKTIKDGSCLFIYYPDKKYLASSGLIS